MKRILAVMLTLVLAVSLAGCGNNGQTVQSAPMPAAAEDTSIATPSAEAEATSSSAAASGGVLPAEGVTVVLPAGAFTEGWQDAEDTSGVYVLPFSLDGAAYELYLRRSDGVDLSMAGPGYVIELPVGAEFDPYSTYCFFDNQTERTGAVFWTRDGFAFAVITSDRSAGALLEDVKAAVDAGITVETP